MNTAVSLHNFVCMDEQNQAATSKQMPYSAWFCQAALLAVDKGETPVDEIAQVGKQLAVVFGR